MGSAASARAARFARFSKLGKRQALPSQAANGGASSALAAQAM
jgi:hypothetical protein